ncbi:MAG: cupin [Opitutae bacterium]
MAKSANSVQTEGKNFLVAQLDEVEPVPCPCGQARRAFDVPENTTATIHLVDIAEDSRTHYHKNMTEIYLVLEGKLRIINIPIPAFDPEDEWFD